MAITIMLVHDPRNLRAVVEKLCASNNKNHPRFVDFSSLDGTIHFVMFAERVDDDVVVDVTFDDSLRNKAALDVLEHTGDPEDDDFLEVATYHLPLEEGPDLDREYGDVMADINEIVGMSICPCEKRFKYHEDEICLLCLMTCPKFHGDMPREFCCVCQKTTIEIGMKKLACCSNFVHKACAARLESCPYCRAALKNIAANTNNNNETPARDQEPQA